MAAETKTSKGKSERVGQVRCQNCFERFRPPPGAEKATCSNCGWEWYISWKGKLAKIRKPVWESWERLLAEAQRSVDNS
jgi:rRNA maturation endonuclease Nob1